MTITKDRREERLKNYISANRQGGHFDAKL